MSDADTETLFTVSVEDAEEILGRPLQAGEADNIRKALEWGLADAVSDAIVVGADDLDENDAEVLHNDGDADAR